MHTYRTDKAVFNYNSDLSGNIFVTNENCEEIEIDGNSLLEFIIFYLRGRLINIVENLTIDKLLKISGK